MKLELASMLYEVRHPRHEMSIDEYCDAVDEIARLAHLCGETINSVARTLIIIGFEP